MHQCYQSTAEQLNIILQFYDIIIMPRSSCLRRSIVTISEVLICGSLLDLITIDMLFPIPCNHRILHCCACFKKRYRKDIDTEKCIDIHLILYLHLNQSLDSQHEVNR